MCRFEEGHSPLLLASKVRGFWQHLCKCSDGAPGMLFGLDPGNDNEASNDENVYMLLDDNAAHNM